MPSLSHGVCPQHVSDKRMEGKNENEKKKVFPEPDLKGLPDSQHCFDIVFWINYCVGGSSGEEEQGC